MSEKDDDPVVREIHALRGEVREYSTDIKDRLDNHGKRIDSLESTRDKATGAMAMFGTLCGAVGGFIHKLIGTGGSS